MKQTDNERALNADPELAEIERELAQMADEVPPMPDDFHAKWMSAVRAEAEQAHPSEPEKAGDASDGKPEHRAVIITHSRWFRALSMAAVFVFLIGGTFLYRSTRGRLRDMEVTLGYSPVSVTAQPAAEEPEMEAEAEEPEMEVAGEKPVMEIAGEELGMKAAGEESEEFTGGSAGEAAAPVMETAGEESEEFTGGSAGEAAAPVTETAEPVFAVPPSANAAFETAGETAREAMPRPTEAPVPTATAAVTPVKNGTPEDAVGPKASETAESGNFWQSVGDFMEDMARFLLAVLPYLLAAAAVITGIVLIRRRKTR